MIQFLFAGIFFITTFPILAHLFAYARDAESRLRAAGIAGKVLLAVLIVLLAAVQRGWLREMSGSAPLTLLNSGAFLYLVTIPIHETGHFLFMPLGSTMMIFGGSFFELLVPFGMLVRLLAVRCPILASLALFLLGQHLVHVGQYMSTARHHEGMVFLSLDQSPETHDWFQLFTRAGLLEQDTAIAALTMNAGTAVAGIAVLFLFLFSNDEENGDEPEPLDLTESA